MSYIPTFALEGFFGNYDGPFNWGTDDIRVLLTQGDAQTTVDTETGKEYVGGAGGYTTLGELAHASYTGQTPSPPYFSGRYQLTTSYGNAGTSPGKMDAADATWTNLTSDDPSNFIGWALIYEHVGADSANSNLVAIDLAEVVVNGVDFTIQWSGDGIFTAT